MHMPNITQAQVLVFVSVAATVLSVLFKLNLTPDEQAVIAGAIVSVWGAAHLVSDAIIRRGRARAMADIHIANARLGAAVDAKPDPDV